MSSSSSSLGTSGDGRASLEVRINRCCPPPEHWTKVKELNVENREPCEVKAHTQFCKHKFYQCHIYYYSHEFRFGDPESTINLLS